MGKLNALLNVAQGAAQSAAMAQMSRPAYQRKIRKRTRQRAEGCSPCEAAQKVEQKWNRFRG